MILKYSIYGVFNQYCTLLFEAYNTHVLHWEYNRWETDEAPKNPKCLFTRSALILFSESKGNPRKWISKSNKLKGVFVYHVKKKRRICLSTRVEWIAIFVNSFVFSLCLWCSSSILVTLDVRFSDLEKARQGIWITPTNVLRSIWQNEKWSKNVNRNISMGKINPRKKGIWIDQWRNAYKHVNNCIFFFTFSSWMRWYAHNALIHPQQQPNCERNIRVIDLFSLFPCIFQQLQLANK